MKLISDEENGSIMKILSVAEIKEIIWNLQDLMVFLKSYTNRIGTLFKRRLFLLYRNDLDSELFLLILAAPS